MNAADDYHFETSQKELAAEILKQAAVDLRRFHDATSAVEREFYLDAHRWVTSDDSSWPFSFSNVCQTLNLAPETVREEVLGDLSIGRCRLLDTTLRTRRTQIQDCSWQHFHERTHRERR